MSISDILQNSERYWIELACSSFIANHKNTATEQPSSWLLVLQINHLKLLSH